MDLRGLAGLASRIISLLGEPEKHSGDPLELFGVSRICEQRGETTRARKHDAQSIERSLPAEADRLARRALGADGEARRDLVSARESSWESMVGNWREGLEAFEANSRRSRAAAGGPISRCAWRSTRGAKPRS